MVEQSKVGDTRQLVSGQDQSSLSLGDTSASEILDVVLLSLKASPMRTDLWLMRFDILRTIGLRAEFDSAIQEAYANKALRREINWIAVRRMRDELSGDAPPPAGVKLPKLPAKPIEQSEKIIIRRFSDIALQIAGPELNQLAQAYQALRARPNFFTAFAKDTRRALKRPTPLQRALSLERKLGNKIRIFLKREDQHKFSPELEMAVAHAHIATALGRQFVITGNDVDEFSVALAEIAPIYGLKATIVLGLDEMASKQAHIAHLRDLGAQVETLRGEKLIGKDPREAALRLWKRMHRTCHLALSFGAGPMPYPRMVSDFQMLLGYETELQLRAQSSSHGPRVLVATVHSEADSIGFMLPYLKRKDIELFYAEPVDPEQRSAWQSSSRLQAYNGARREHTWLRKSGRITHIPVNDDQARAMQDQMMQMEAALISLEDARAVALVEELVRSDAVSQDIVVLVS